MHVGSKKLDLRTKTLAKGGQFKERYLSVPVDAIIPQPQVDKLNDIWGDKTLGRLQLPLTPSIFYIWTNI